MEKETGTILFAKDEHAKLEPASVTKVMTLLLTMEAIDAGQLTYDTVITASAHACSMGGSQIWLKENEQMTVSDMLKAVCGGVRQRLRRGPGRAGGRQRGGLCGADEPPGAGAGHERHHVQKCHRPAADGHVTCAYDIALMSRELILNHPDIREYTTIWMDTLRDGTSQLVQHQQAHPLL